MRSGMCDVGRHSRGDFVTRASMQLATKNVRWQEATPSRHPFPQLDWNLTFTGDPSKASLQSDGTKPDFDAHVRLRSEGKDWIRKKINVLHPSNTNRSNNVLYLRWKIDQTLF